MSKSKEWQPSISIQNLKARAGLLKEIRLFFEARSILEVETPLMCRTAGTDPHLKPIAVLYSGTPASAGKNFFLQTSPEFCMKRLLAAGSGSIYQITKAFREDEVGRLHNPEFTLLEWYQIGLDHHALMDEVDALLGTTLKTPPAERLSYQALFQQYFNWDPHQVSLAELEATAKQHCLEMSAAALADLSVDDWLDILMTHCIEPSLGFDRPVMIYDFPASKAALARIRMGDTPVAERFEVYVQGVELANGYHELTEAGAQQLRFEQDNLRRQALGYPQIPLDQALLEALASGMPPCAGVALGVDRLLMLKLQSLHIQEVVTFTADRA